MVLESYNWQRPMVEEVVSTGDLTANPQPTAPKARGGKKSTFAGDVLKLVSGTTVAQALGVLLAPLLTRLYSPESFGVLALFTSITSIVGVVASLRYELAIMLPEADEEGANLLAVSLGFVLLITGLTVPVVILGRPLLLHLLKAPALGPYLWLIPAMVFFAGAFEALNYWNSRTRHFGRQSLAQVISTTSTQVTRLGAGYAGHATTGTQIGTAVLGPALSAFVLGCGIWHDNGRLFRFSVRWQRMLAGMKRYQRFPLFEIWSGLLNTVSWQLPALLLTQFFSATVVGHYSLGLRVLQLPMGVIGGAIGRVFFQRAAEARIEGKLAQVTQGGFRRLVMIGLFPMLILALIGREAFAVVFGAQWAEAGTYAQILSVWTCFWFISSPLSTLYGVLERQDLSLALNGVIFATRLLSLWIGGLLQNPRMALVLFALSGTLTYGYLTVKIVSMAGVPWREVWSALGAVLPRFVPTGAVLILLKAVGASPWAITAVAGVLIAAHYAWEMGRDPRFHSLMRRVRSHEEG